MIEAQEICDRIQRALPGAEVKISDLTGGGDHYQVEVISEQFEGIPPLKRHRMVHAPLKDVLGGALHALALTTKTPAETAVTP